MTAATEPILLSKITSREIRLVSRPRGLPTEANFAMDRVELGPLENQQVLVRNLFMSVDPYMRGRMNAGKSYVPPFEVGRPLDGGAVGMVVASRAGQFQAGDTVLSNYGWRDCYIAAAKELHPVNPKIQPLSVFLGALGMPGLTAWAGLKLVDVKASDVVYLSGAAGAVGSTAGQLAKLKGCRVIGSAGSDEKVKFLVEDCGFDAAFNYRTGSILDQLKAAAPEGIDVYFDNVGGDSLEAALSALRVHGRIICCGSITGYNDEQPRPGPSNLFNIIGKRLILKGLLVRDWLDRQAEFELEVGGYVLEGRLRPRETVVQGLDHAVAAFLGLFQGQNIGKMTVALP
jgi:NADPH-dependent curcumin reductase CurA